MLGIMRCLLSKSYHNLSLWLTAKYEQIKHCYKKKNSLFSLFMILWFLFLKTLIKFHQQNKHKDVKKNPVWYTNKDKILFNNIIKLGDVQGFSKELSISLSGGEKDVLPQSCSWFQCCSSSSLRFTKNDKTLPKGLAHLIG